MPRPQRCEVLAAASMSAGCVRMGCDPADRQQEGTLVNRLDAVRHARSHGHQHARRDVTRTV
jgi:hypothetical protein